MLEAEFTVTATLNIAYISGEINANFLDSQFVCCRIFVAVADSSNISKSYFASGWLVKMNYHYFSHPLYQYYYVSGTFFAVRVSL